VTGVQTCALPIFETVLRESENAMLADHEISDLLADRLADNCRFAADYQHRGLATPSSLDSLARLAGIARLDVYSPGRELLVSSHPESSPTLLPPALLDEYNSFEPGVYQGLLTALDAGFSVADRSSSFFAVALQEPDGRWAAAWIDGHKLTNLRRRLQKEQDPGVRAELEEAIQTKEAQLANLRNLENYIKRADIQLDHTLSALGTVYAQVQLIDSKDLDSAPARRLQQDIRDEVLSLQDTISAIDEVQSYTTSSHG